MPRISAKLSIRKFQPRTKTEAQIDKTIRRAYWRAIRDFLTAAAPLVPVITGMAKGSLSPLAESVNYPFPEEGSPARGFLPDGTEIEKSWELGASQATKPPYIKQVGDQYVFVYQSRVYHYRLRDLESVPGGKPTPWNSFEMGLEAFERRFNHYIRTNLSRVLARALNAEVTTGAAAQPVEVPLRGQDLSQGFEFGDEEAPF